MTTTRHDNARLATLRAALAALDGGRFEEAARLAGTYARGEGDVEAALLHALGVGASGRFGEAAPLLDAVARARPNHAHPVRDLVGILQRRGRLDAAAASVRAVLALRPSDSALGALLAELGDAPGAIACFEAAVSAQPGDAAAWSNLGKALAAEGRFVEASAAHDDAVALDPMPQLRLNRAMNLLKAGRFAEGFAAWECRHELPGHPAMPPGPRLDLAQPVEGRTVLLVHEEGFGDTIMLVRYAALLAERGARVVAWVPPPLARLIATAPGVTAVAVMDGPRPGCGLPACDLIAPMLDLLGAFRTVPETIPASVPYLSAEAAEVERWRARLAGRPGLRVGLVWAGAARKSDPAALATDRLRSFDSALLAPLLAVPGTVPVSLQWGAAAPPGALQVMDGVRDFMDTAAIIEALDLVVSVDTAVAHLAGALGKTVLLLDRYDNCWRWLHRREDTPWYPTMRLLRQSRAGDWPPVVASAAEIVAALTDGVP
jgi:Flp pilus assembly protein TadD